MERGGAEEAVWRGMRSAVVRARADGGIGAWAGLTRVMGQAPARWSATTRRSRGCSPAMERLGDWAIQNTRAGKAVWEGAASPGVGVGLVMLGRAGAGLACGCPVGGGGEGYGMAARTQSKREGD